LLTARLFAMGFEGFYEDEEVLVAYIPADNFSAIMLEGIEFTGGQEIHLDYRVLAEKNWNEEWEKNFSPVVIAGRCLVRAPFHPALKKYPVEIIIEPKMAFGTGHHATTEMIAGYLLSLDLEGTFVFDMGCGSGILGIIAALTGAARVEMADNDPVAVANALENASRNKADHIAVYTGGKETLNNKRPDIITANISKPVLMDQMASYSTSLAPGGILIISGIIDSDYKDLVTSAEKCGFLLMEKNRKQEWLMLVFKKSGNI
jgi:ribosomal protein L11 methyltransferase